MTETLAFGAWRATRDRDGAVLIAPTHPLDVASALVGAPTNAAPAIAKALHALCPMAHSIAVRRALEAMSGRAAPATLEAARIIALEAEAAAAAAFRFGALWPAALGFKPHPAAGAARRAADALTRATFAGREDDTSGPALAVALREVLQDAAEPSLRAAQPLQDAPDTDRPGDSLHDRLLALVLDARLRAQGCESLKAVGAAAPPDPPAPKDGVGQGAAAALRGAVFVRLEAVDGKIVRAEINTPTDRVLAPHGPLARALARLPSALAPLAVLAFDPCAPVLCALEDAREPAHA